MVTVTVGKNSFGTVVEADTYLDGSIRAASKWLGVAPDDKKRCMISAYRKLDAKTWQGTSAGMQIVDLASVNAGGTGYVVNELLTVPGGTFGEAAVVKVTSVAAGVVDGIELYHAGIYSANPTTPATVTGGSGTGCTVDLTFTDQVADFPRTELVDCDGDSLDGTTYPTNLKAGQFELAYELSQDADLENSSGSGTNTKRVKADTVEVEFFQPKSDTRPFPVVVQNLVGCMLAGNAAAAGIGGFRGGENQESFYDDYPDNYGLNGAL